VFVPAFAFVIGFVGTVAWIGAKKRTGLQAPSEIQQSERTPANGREFELEITIRVPTSVTAVNDVIEYRFKRIRVIEVYLIKEKRVSLTNVNWKSISSDKTEAEAFEIVMSEKRVRILDFRHRGFFKEDFSSFTSDTYDDILHIYSTPSPTPEEGA
jgi:hypothetical protein